MNRVCRQLSAWDILSALLLQLRIECSDPHEDWVAWCCLFGVECRLRCPRNHEWNISSLRRNCGFGINLTEVDRISVDGRRTSCRPRFCELEPCDAVLRGGRGVLYNLFCTMLEINTRGHATNHSKGRAVLLSTFLSNFMFSVFSSLIIYLLSIYLGPFRGIIREASGVNELLT